MKQLFFSELRRYKKSTVIFFVTMLMAFAYVSGDRSPLPIHFKYEFVNFFPMLAAAVFGLVQMYLHKRANHWAYLIHRPLSMRQIFFALVGAGMTIIFVATTLPFLLVTIYSDAFTFQNVDLRDYSNIFLSLLKYYVFYLTSCLVIVNASKGSALIYISFLYLLYDSTPLTNFTQFMPASICILVLFYLNAISFKPDIKSFSNRPIGLIFHSTVMMIGIFFVLLLSVTLLHEIGRTALHGKGDASASKGTMRYFTHLTQPEDMLAYALEDSTHPNADHYVKQAELADSSVLPKIKFKFPFRGQTVHPHGLSGMSYQDLATNTLWHFSHDSMLIEGRHLATNQSMGFLGVRGFLDPDESIQDSDRFSNVPIISHEKHLITPKTLYYVDFEEQLFEVRQQLQGEERYVSWPIQRPQFFALKTNRRLMLFDKQNFDSESSKLNPEYTVPYPVSYQNIDGIRVYELVDGHLIHFQGMDFYGYDQPGFEVVHAKLSGEVESIGERVFAEFYIPAWRRQLEEIIAPVLFYAIGSYDAWAETDPIDMSERYRLLSVYPYMAVIQLFSFFVVLLMCRRQRLNRVLTLTWAGLTAVFGLPALVSFFLLNPWIPLKRLFGAVPAKQDMDSGSHEPLSV